jgi:hypothetical protein
MQPISPQPPSQLQVASTSHAIKVSREAGKPRFLEVPGPRFWQYWACQFGGWGALGALFILSEQVSEVHEPFWTTFQNYAIMVLLWLLSSHLLHALIRNKVLSGQGNTWRQLGRAMVMVIVVSLLGSLLVNFIVLLAIPWKSERRT